MNVNTIGPGWPISEENKERLIRSCTTLEREMIIFIGSERKGSLFFDQYTPGSIDFNNFGPTIVTQLLYPIIQNAEGPVTLVDLIGRRIISDSAQINSFSEEEIPTFEIVNKGETTWKTYIDQIAAKPLEEEQELLASHNRHKCVIL